MSSVSQFIPILTSEQLATLNKIAAPINQTGLQFLTTIYAPFVQSLNKLIFPCFIVLWFCLGFVLFEAVTHAIRFDRHLLRNWKHINAFYFILRYAGIIAVTFLCLLTIVGQKGTCNIVAKIASIFEAITLVSALAIFYVRIAALTNFNYWILAFFAIIGLADFVILLHSTFSTFGNPPPSFAPIILCTAGVSHQNFIAIVCFLTVLYDVGILLMTIWALRHLRIQGKGTKSSQLKYQLIRQNLSYVGIVSTIELIQGIFIIVNPPSIPVLVMTPIVIAVTSVLGCRVFIDLKFESIARTNTGTTISGKSSNKFNDAMDMEYGGMNYGIGFTSRNHPPPFVLNHHNTLRYGGNEKFKNSKSLSISEGYLKANTLNQSINGIQVTKTAMVLAEPANKRYEFGYGYSGFGTGSASGSASVNSHESN